MKKEINALLIAICIGCFSTNSFANIKENYKKSCKNCKTEESSLLIGHRLECDCKNWDKKYVKTSIWVGEECADVGVINNCNGKLLCEKKCPKKKFLGIF